MNNTIKLIVSDMDGTLLNSDKQISELNLNIISQLAEKNILFAFGTGRNFVDLNPFVKALAFPTAAIALNGGIVCDHNGDIISKEYFKSDDIIALMEVVAKYDFYIELQDYKNFYTNSEKLRIEWLTKVIPSSVLDPVPKKSDYYTKTVFTDFNHGFLRETPIYKLIIGNLYDRDLEEVIQDLRQNCICELSSSGHGNLEINPIGINKGFGINKLCEHYKFTAENVMAIGDNLNDLSMLETAGTFYAMENSHPFILEKAKHVTADDNNDGVAKAIAEILGIRI